jgi:hypothetical protein
MLYISRLSLGQSAQFYNLDCWCCNDVLSSKRGVAIILGLGPALSAMGRRMVAGSPRLSWGYERTAGAGAGRCTAADGPKKRLLGVVWQVLGRNRV